MSEPLAQTPPMGWNSFDCYDVAVTEEEVIGNAEYMARHLKQYGWQYIVIDMSWFDQVSAAFGRSDVPLDMDEYGRLIPCVEKFPSAAEGLGFRPLADRIHAMGLKFGIHIMRGITQQAVRRNTPILGTDARARDIADQTRLCNWWEPSCGVHGAKPASQAWYDSCVQLWADWGVDFLKADDMSFPYAARDLEMLRSSLDRLAPHIVLSLSPGETPLAMAEHVKTRANMWRISGDFWDEWPQLLKMFDLLENWNPHLLPGHWPDADMLPLGLLSIRRNPPKPMRVTRFTAEEQRTMMTLWCIARSPLFFGGDLRVMDAWTLALITNPEVLAMHRSSSGNRVLFRNDYRTAWTAQGPDGSAYLALFNTGDLEELQISAEVADLLPGPARVKELWTQQDLGTITGRVQAVVPPHGAKLFRLEPVR